MFDGCNGLTELDIFGWNIANVSNITNMLKGLTNLETIITPYQFDSSGLFQREFKSSLVDKQIIGGLIANNRLRDIGNLQLITKVSDIRPGYVYTCKNTEIANEARNLSSNIVNILN